MAKTEHRRRAYRAGLWAETIAVWVLRLKGFRILARRARTPVGEIDIVAKRGATIAFVEVKARQDADTAAQSLTATQRRRIARAAQAFLAVRSDLAGLDARFDMVLVPARGFPRHLPAAWRPEADI